MKKLPNFVENERYDKILSREFLTYLRENFFSAFTNQVIHAAVN